MFQIFIDRFRYNANRASQVQSKLKLLEKLWVSNATYFGAVTLAKGFGADLINLILGFRKQSNKNLLIECVGIELFFFIWLSRIGKMWKKIIYKHWSLMLSKIICGEEQFWSVWIYFRPKLTPVEKERPTVIKFPSHSDLSGVALRLDEVNFHYSKEKTIFKNVDISACYDSRICIVSSNCVIMTYYYFLLAYKV